MDRVHFTINDKPYSVGGEFPVHTTLNEFIRRHAEQRGTKYMCLEGGCGACIVNVQAARPNTREVVTFSVNSCLVLIMSCDGWDITTVEGIGNRKKGYNIIQKRLNHYFGSQCGYCSPGFVMSMYSLIKDKGHLTEEEIEKSFGSNLCRCTGYRPILEAFKSFAINADKQVLDKIKDIEDITEQTCPRSGKKCGESCDNYEDWCLLGAKKSSDSMLPKKIHLADGRLWYAVKDIPSIFSTLDDNGYDSYMIVAGNTGRGVRPIKFFPKILIDVSNVTELTAHYLDVNLVLGGNITLTETMNLFHELSKTNDDFWYLKILHRHMERVAHIPVRNIGTLAGNLAVKNRHPDFQSDIFLLFDCIGATVTLVDRQQNYTEMTLTNFLSTDLTGKLIKQIKLPPLSRNYEMVTYKITPREQNAHAEVNAAFLFKFDPHTHRVVEASIVYGGINPSFSHAYETEKHLVGQFIFTNEVVQSALSCLDSEIHPDINPPDPSPSFRKKLALSLFYKVCLIYTANIL
ncbi:indole-3-acetaldehyde oxidase [Manduca sexta]|uniref:indole-3-acetaldehyde oxidase n=1 Tax=Manduca sexta TaxID=7130 RepID=UPI00188FA0B8|nr:indole-3-acetaldehyde oxidase [Manduca sexta]